MKFQSIIDYDRGLFQHYLVVAAQMFAGAGAHRSAAFVDEVLQFEAPLAEHPLEALVQLHFALPLLHVTVPRVATDMRKALVAQQIIHLYFLVSASHKTIINVAHTVLLKASE